MLKFIQREQKERDTHARARIRVRCAILAQSHVCLRSLRTSLELALRRNCVPRLSIVPSGNCCRVSRSAPSQHRHLLAIISTTKLPPPKLHDKKRRVDIYPRFSQPQSVGTEIYLTSTGKIFFLLQILPRFGIAPDTLGIRA